MNIAYLASFTFRDLVRSKIMWNIPLLGLVMLIVTFVTREFTYGVPGRVVTDVGLGCLTLACYGITFFAGCTLVRSEMESRTIYLIISRPVGRVSFLLGKIAGVVAFLATNVAALSIIYFGLLYWLAGSVSTPVLVTTGFVLLESIVLLVLIVVLSMVSNLALTLMFGVILLAAGHAVGATQDILWLKRLPWLQTMLRWYDWVFPAFYKLNFKDYAVYSNRFPWDQVPKAIGYSVTYLGGLLCLGCGIIRDKDFD